MAIKEIIFVRLSSLSHSLTPYSSSTFVFTVKVTDQTRIVATEKYYKFLLLTRRCTPTLVIRLIVSLITYARFTIRAIFFTMNLLFES